MKDWKVKFYLEGCDNMSSVGLCGKNCEVDMPYIPRVGELVWLSDACSQKLKQYVAECWKEKKCADCPYMYGKRDSVNCISIGDYIHVNDIIYDIEGKDVLVSLID